MPRRKPWYELSKRHVRRLILNEINNESVTAPGYSCKETQNINNEVCPSASGDSCKETKNTNNEVHPSTSGYSCKETPNCICNIGDCVYEDSIYNLDIDTHDILHITNQGTKELSVSSENAVSSFVHSEDTLKYLLAAWAIDCNINLQCCTKLLKVLRTHKCLSNLPSDARTLLKTPRVLMQVVPMTPGHYIHFGLENGIKMLIQIYGEHNLNDEIKLTLNIDGLPLFKSSPYSFWPILASFDSCAEIIIVGVYYGESKPHSINEYLHMFVQEFNILSNEGLSYSTKTFQIIMKNIVCDAPAKSYILNVKGHSGYSSCTKCKIEGVYKKNRVCFPETKVNTLRTDEGFRQKEDDDFHLSGFSPLITIPKFDMIKDVPYDYMHLICLGVTKKLLLLWQTGSLKYRLPHHKIEQMSEKLLELRKYTPVEFCQKPRSLKFVKFWKATEYRQFLLYTGFTVISQVVKKDILINFLSLMAGIRIFCNKNICTSRADYADEILIFFVKTFKIIYGEHNMSHNIHGILHIKEDVMRHGSLDTYSCFKFENYMQTIKSHIRKPEKPLQQLKKRYEETCSQNMQKKRCKLSYNVFETSQHFDGPLTDGLIPDKQYRKATCNGFVLNSLSVANCIFSVRGTEDIIKILNIVQYGGKYYVVSLKFSRKEDLFTSPYESSLIGVYFVSQLNSKETLYLLDDIAEKYYCMPYKKGVDGLIVVALLHRD